jgi:hypothetical protein
MENITAFELLEELESWLTVDMTDKTKAVTSGIDTTSNPEFRELVEGWTSGKYDEDPDVLKQEILNLVNK